MTTFVHFDPVFRNLTGMESSYDEEAFRAVLDRRGASYIEIPGDLPGSFEDLCVRQDGELMMLQDLPALCRHPDLNIDVPIAVPEMPDLPDGAIVDPPIGTVLTSGTNTIAIRTPWYKRHTFTVFIWTAEDRKADLIAHAAALRDAVADGGIMFRGHRIASDDRCAMKVIRAIETSRRDPAWSTTWECADGTTLAVMAVDVGALHDAIEANHDDAFARYTRTKAGIVAGTITTPDQVAAEMAADA